MKSQDNSGAWQIGRAHHDFMRGRISRREMLRRAAAAGAGAATLTALAGFRGAAAQDATPAAGGITITAQAGLRTDLGGQRISVVTADPTSPDNPWLDRAFAIFTETTGITVNKIPGETSATDRLQNYRQQFAAQSTDIDVYQVDVIWPGIVAEFAVPLQDTLGDLAALQFPALVQNNTIDGNLVAMPWYTDAGLLYYRTDLLEKYGFANPPATWDELQQQAQAIQDGERAGRPDLVGFVFQGNAYEGLTCNGLEWQVSHGGGTIVDAESGEVTVNNPQAIAAFERARSWVGTIAPQAVTTYDEPASLASWVTGATAFMRNWPYAFAASQDPANSTVAGMVGVTSLPMGTGEGARNAAALGGWNMMVSRFSQAQDAALEFVKFMCSPELQKSFMLDRSHSATIATTYDDPQVIEQAPFFASLKDVFQGGAVARPSSVSGDLYGEVSSSYFQQLNAVLSGSRPAAEAAAQMQSDIESILSGD